MPKNKSNLQKLREEVAGILIHLPSSIQKRRTERRLECEREGTPIEFTLCPPLPEPWESFFYKMAARDGILLKMWLQDKTKFYKGIPFKKSIRITLRDVMEWVSLKLWDVPSSSTNKEFKSAEEILKNPPYGVRTSNIGCVFKNYFDPSDKDSGKD